MLRKFLCLIVSISFLVSCSGSHMSFVPKNPYTSALSNQAKDEFETGAYREKDPTGMWVIGILAGAAIIGSAILVPLYINDKL